MIKLRLLILIVGVLSGTVFLLDQFLPLPVTDNISWSTKVVDRDGRLLRLFTTKGGFWRLPANLDHTYPEFVRQLLAYEDKRFWNHIGVDPFAVSRAAFQYIRNGKIVSGASTITMQTVRLLEPRPRTVSSKLIEMIQALRLERRLNKKEILELYLSLAPYGGNIQGIEAASIFYFNGDAEYLNPSQAALLIGLPQSPESRRPDLHPARAKNARNDVIERLLLAGLLTEEEASLAAIQKVPTKRFAAPFSAPQLSRSLRQEYPGKNVIVTTIDYTLQAAAENVAARIQKELPAGKTLAILVVDNHSRQVLAHIGSGDFATSQLDLTRAVRSPGSTLKPFIYGLAFEQNILHPETRILDRSRRFEDYGPKNFDGKNYGWITARQALQQSLNIPAVQVLGKVGPQRLLSRFSNMEIQLKYHEAPGLSLALGGVGTNLQDLTSLYCTLANEGKYRPLQITPDNIAIKEKVLLSPMAAWYVDDILRSALLPVNLFNNQNKHNTIRFKTGTSYGFRDAWVVGYNQNFTVGVWVGRLDGGYGKDTTGSSAALPILLQIFANLPENSSRTKTKGAPAEALLVRHSDLPIGMQWLDGKRHDDRYAGKPRITFPVDGSKLQMTGNDKDQHGIALKVSGGTPPFHWLVNGSLVDTRGNNATTYFNPQGPGMARIVIVDGKGGRDKVSVWLENLSL